MPRLVLAQAAPPAAAAPPAPRWHGGVTFSTTWTSSKYDQTMVSLDGTAVRVSPKWSYTFSTQVMYGKLEQNGKLLQVIADSDTVRFLATRDITPRTFIAIQPAYTRNALLAIDYHFEELAGYGVRLVTKPRGHLTFVGVGGAVQNKKNIEATDGGSAVVGLLQNADAVIAKDAKGPTWTWTERVLYLVDVTRSGDNRLDFKTSLTGRIKGPVNLSLAYQIVREAIVLAGNQKDDQSLLFGVGWSF